MAAPPLKPLIDSTLDVIEGLFYLSFHNSKGWVKSNGVWHFLYSLRVFRSWMYETFREQFEKHKHFALACANEGFTIGEVHHHSPLHALGYLTEQVSEAFIGFERYADLKSLPLTLSTRKRQAWPGSSPRTDTATKDVHYQSLFEDVLEAWPVQEKEPNAPRKSTKVTSLDSIDPLTKRRIQGESSVEETIEAIRSLRDVERIDARLAGELTRDQWVSLLNLWIAADSIEKWFADLTTLLKGIDLTVWWSGIDRQLARMELFFGIAQASEVFVDREDNPFGTSGSKCPVVIDGNDAYLNGQRLPRLSPARFQVIKALVKAYPSRLVSSQLVMISGKAEAARYANEISSSHPEWAKVLSLPKKYGDGFAITRPTEFGIP